MQTDWTVHAQDSVDQLADGDGQPLNRDAFVLRRGRLRAEGEAPFVAYAVELDVNTVDGAQAGFRQVEAALRWAPGEDAALHGLEARLGAGVFATPFGHSVYVERDGERLLLERPLWADALFPGQLDVGARLDLRWQNWVHLTVAVVNGQPLGGGAFPGRDPDAAKDVVGRVATRGALGPVRLGGGVSALQGTGFHAGTPPSKERFVWRDLNEDGVVQTSEITSTPPAAGTPSETFERWGVGADLQAEVDVPRVGPLRLQLEGALATNLDRGLRPADPVTLGRDQRALGGAVTLTQAWGPLTVGGRADHYAPELDARETRAGGVVRRDETFTRWSALVAWDVGAAPDPRGRLTVEYTHLADALGRDAAGAPADLANDRVVARLQVAF